MVGSLLLCGAFFWNCLCINDGMLGFEVVEQIAVPAYANVPYISLSCFVFLQHRQPHLSVKKISRLHWYVSSLTSTSLLHMHSTREALPKHSDTTE